MGMPIVKWCFWVRCHKVLLCLFLFLFSSLEARLSEVWLQASQTLSSSVAPGYPGLSGFLQGTVIFPSTRSVTGQKNVWVKKSLMHWTELQGGWQYGAYRIRNKQFSLPFLKECAKMCSLHSAFPRIFFFKLKVWIRCQSHKPQFQF